VPFFDTAKPKVWQATLARLAKVKFERLVPGHGPVMTREQFAQYRTAFDHLLACGASSKTNEECATAWLADVGALVPEAEHAFTGDGVLLEMHFQPVDRAPAGDHHVRRELPAVADQRELRAIALLLLAARLRDDLFELLRVVREESVQRVVERAAGVDLHSRHFAADQRIAADVIEVPVGVDHRARLDEVEDRARVELVASRVHDDRAVALLEDHAVAVRLLAGRELAADQMHARRDLAGRCRQREREKATNQGERETGLH
jgi:hypothetical protein